MTGLAYWQSIGQCICVLYRFTEADMITTMIPTTFFAAVAAPLCDSSRLPHVIFWIWIHLLQFNVANQVLDPEEDGRNKPSRPIPAGLISIRNATILRWSLIPISLLLSAMYSTHVFSVSVVLSSLVIWYNELRAHEHWFSKNVMTAVGYSSFELGGTLVAGCKRSHLEPVAMIALALSVVIFATTLHCQDFKDEEGDRLIGRKTLPIVFPALARISVMVGLPLWSLCLACVWKIDVICSAAFVAYAGLIGVRFMMLQDAQADRMSCKLYSVSP
ncbi:UbiA prenyltransferase family [Melanogaster broomeanus]|nr:UbiA prenyltransferase family [Melanogaster broomeanus]